MSEIRFEKLSMYDRKAEPIPDWSGVALVDVRPGLIVGGDPGGDLMRFAGGVADLDLRIVHAFGETRFWVEECGSASAPAAPRETHLRTHTRWRPTVTARA